MGEPLVRGRDVSRAYRSGPSTTTALSDASFEVWPGDLVAIVGPSGSGKSTLLHLIGGIDRPTGGSLTWPELGGIEHLRPGPVSMAFQGPSLMAPLTVEENVALPLLLQDRAEEEALDEAREMLARVDLLPLAARLPEDLSGGQAQRAAVARALVGTPRLVLADEPTGQQDRPGGRALMDALLGRAKETGMALLVATHDQTVAERFSIRWTLADGRLLSGVAVRSG